MLRHGILAHAVASTSAEKKMNAYLIFHLFRYHLIHLIKNKVEIKTHMGTSQIAHLHKFNINAHYSLIGYLTYFDSIINVHNKKVTYPILVYAQMAIS